jgi:GNAT superfamily N-acetyltransferase
LNTKANDKIWSASGLEEKGDASGSDQSEAIVAVISLFCEPVPGSPLSSTPGPSESEVHDNSDVAIEAGNRSSKKDGVIDVGAAVTSRVESPYAIRFRKFACLPIYRGQGIGTLLLKESLRLVNDELPGDQRANIAWCDARVETKKWYERRGMRELLSAGGGTPARFYKGEVEYLRMVLNI